MQKNLCLCFNCKIKVLTGENMIRRVENSPSFGSTVIRDHVFKKGYDFTEKFGTNIDKRVLRRAISFLENDGKNSIYRIEEAERNYPITDFVLLKDNIVVKKVGGYVNPEFNIVGTLVRYAKDMGLEL